MEILNYMMTVRLLKALAIVALIVQVTIASAQSLEITRVEQEGMKIDVYYDLVDTAASNRYSLELFSSYDQYTKPLTKVLGDVGQEVAPGRNLKITWYMALEYGESFAQQNEEKINFEIRGDLFVPFLVMNEYYPRLLRGRTYTFNWETQSETEQLTVELLRGDESVSTTTSVEHGGFSLTVPPNTRPGKGYRLRISDPDNEKNTYTTDPFVVRRRVPLIVYFTPALAVLFIVSPPEPVSQKLPDPLKPE